MLSKIFAPSFIFQPYVRHHGSTATQQRILHLLLVLSLLLSSVAQVITPAIYNRAPFATTRGLPLALPLPVTDAPPIQPNRAAPSNEAKVAPITHLATAMKASDPAAIAARPSSISEALLPTWFSAPTSLSALPDPPQRNHDGGGEASLLRGLTAVALFNNEMAAQKSTAEEVAVAPEENATVQSDLSAALLPNWFTPPARPLQEPFLEAANAPLYFPGVGACLSITDTPTAITPPLTLQQGNLTGGLFTIGISNNTTTTQSVPELSLLSQPPAGFYFIGNSATATSTVDGALPLIQPTGDSSPGQSFTIFLSGLPAANSLAPGETIILSYQLAANYSAHNGQSLIATWQSGDTPSPVACVSASAPVETALCPRPTQLTRTLTLPPGRVSMGNHYGDIYTYTITNNSVYTSYASNLLIDPAVGFFFKAGSATATSSRSGLLFLAQPTSDTTPDATIEIAPFAAHDLAPGENLIYTFKLGTTVAAASGQHLKVSLRSGASSPQVCDTTLKNVATGRGNLVLQKDESPQFGSIGDIITWTVTARNSGLGNVYTPTLTELSGAGVTILEVDPPLSTLPTILTPEESMHFTVTGALNACFGLNNRVLGAWSIGNVDGTGILGNPVSARADIVYQYADDNITIAIDPIDVEFCGTLDLTRTVTVINRGGAVNNLRLNTAASDALSIINLDTANWNTVGNQFIYIGMPGGILGRGQSITFELHITSASTICAADNGSITFTPLFGEACTPVANLTTTPYVLDVGSNDAPTIQLEKTASITEALPGDTVYYTLTVTGRNPGNILAPGIRITDSLPSQLVNLQYSTSLTPTTTPFVGSLLDIIMPVESGTYSAQVYIQGDIPASDVCGTGYYINRARASTPFCPECNLAYADYAELIVTMPPGGPGSGNSFTMQEHEVEICGASLPTQRATISITNGITWTGTLFEDELDTDSGPGPLYPSNVQLFVDGINRTADVTVTTTTTTPRLHVALDNIGTYSDTALIEITYNISAAVDATPGNGIYFSRFSAGGFSDLPACGLTAVALNRIALERAGMGELRLDPPTLASCRVNTVTLTVDGTNMDTTIADHMVLTFTASASDIMTPTLFTLGGSLAALPTTSITVTQANNVVTFTLPLTLDLASPGSISFALYRPCGVDDGLAVGLGYLDACQAPRTDSATGGLTTLASNLILLTPDITYTVNSTTTPWYFSVRNTGNLAANNAIITLTLPEGHHFDPTAFTVTNVTQPIINGISATTTTVGSHELVFINLAAAPPNQRIEFEGLSTVTMLCRPEGEQLLVELHEPCGAVGGTCADRQQAAWGYEPGVISLLSSNTQSGILPMCAAGDVILTVKNASAAADEYNYVITDTLRGGRYVDGTATVSLINSQGQKIVADVPFAPTSVLTTSLDPFEQELLWEFDQLGSYPAAVQDLLRVRKASDTIELKFRVRTTCQDDETIVSSAVHATNICGTRLERQEEATTLSVGRPTLQVAKQVRNASLAQDAQNKVFAAVGDTLVWQIDIANTGDVGATYINVADDLPLWFNVTATNIITTDQSGQTLIWDFTGTPILPVGDSLQLLITGTVGALACTGDPQNRAVVQLGCGDDDLCSVDVLTATAQIESMPSFAVTAPNATLNQCGPGPLSVSFANNGARATNVVLTYTLPSGVVYSGIATGTNPMPDQLPTMGVTGVITFGYNVVDSLVTTNTLFMRVATDVAVCMAGGGGSADLRYADSCGLAYDDVIVDNFSATVQRSNLIGTRGGSRLQTPANRVVQAGRAYAWNFGLRNSGDGVAYNLVITETLGSGYSAITATHMLTNSTGPGYAPVVAGNVITWSIPSLATSAQLNAIITATVAPDPIDLQIMTTLRSQCDNGGCAQQLDESNFATTREFFTKTASLATVTVGDLISFTIATDLFGNYVYTDVVLTDTLPYGLGYRNAALLVVTDRDGDQGGAVTTLLPPASAPALNGDNAPIVWNLGVVTGQISMTAIITAIVLDRPTTGSQPNYNGLSRTNTATLSYSDDGQSYTVVDTATTTLQEPLLHIGKTYSAPASCRAEYLADNFNDGNLTGWSTSGGAWSVINGSVQPPTSGAHSLFDNRAWGNYSFSALVRSTDNIGDLGLIFRVQDSNNYYRFSWNAGSSNNYRIQRVVAGTATTLGATAGSAYETNRWYHLEVQTIGNRFLIFIDGVQVLDRIDNTDRFPTGGVGFYANNQNVAAFDDLLVTRFDDSGCYVAAGDRVTYTLTISNQNTITAHDLVITDVIPSEMGLLTYTVQSDDSAATVTLAPSPGATGALRWQVDQLAAPDPFTFTDHTALRLTLVLTVSDLVPAASLLSNQASLRYDSQQATGPVTIQRAYSGGSHATTLQTAAPQGMLKTATPLTATIGQLIFYTLTLPSPIITATLHNIQVTDLLSPNLALVGSPVISGGVNPTDLSASDGVTVTFDHIDPNQRATIAFTAVVRNIALNQAGLAITNVAQLDWQNGAGTPQPPIVSNVITTTLVEPVLTVDKTIQALGAVRAGDEVTYTLTITHAAQSAATAYDVVLLDQIPNVLTYKAGSLVTAPAATAIATADQLISVTYSSLALTAPTIVITYVVTIDAAAEPSSDLTNTVAIAYTSLPNTSPEERTGSGIGPNDYITSTAASVPTGDVFITKWLHEDRDYTIGEAIAYTVRITVPTGLTRLRPRITDTIPAGLRYEPPIFTTSFVPPNYSIILTPEDGGDGALTSTVSLAFDDVLSNTTGQPATFDWTFNLIVADVATANHGETKTNNAYIVYVDANDQIERADAPPVNVDLIEPQLIIEKSVAPASVKPGDVAFYQIDIYHSPTSTIPAYNVVITDLLPSDLDYISNSWDQIRGPAADLLNDDNPPLLQAAWTIIPDSVTAANPIRLRYNVVVPPDALPGTLYTNTITTIWTSLADDPFGDTRDSSGGVDDYLNISSAALALSEVAIDKTGPLTVTAGALITYLLTVYNSGPYSAIQATATDAMPFQVHTITATYAVATTAGTCTIVNRPDGDSVFCDLGDVPGEVTARIVITALVDANTPEGSDLTNIAQFAVQSPDGNQSNNTKAIETEVVTAADIAVTKTGPLTATAGTLVTYTVTLANHGPSVGRDVDLKDLLPAGLAFVAATTTQGACVSSICQLGDVAVNDLITMVVTATVNSDVTGVVINQARAFGDTYDPDPTNDSDSVVTSVNAQAQLEITKVDLTDPVYAGDTYFYEIVVTNRGPALATTVRFTDTLPGQVSYAGSSPACAETSSGSGTVVCTLGDLAVGATRDYLINVTLDDSVISGTIGVNNVSLTTTTPVDNASVLADSTATTYRQRSGAPTDLLISKRAAVATLNAGSGLVTYTLTVTNAGPAPASAVQVVDALPPAFIFVSAVTSLDTSLALCNAGIVCDLGTLAIGATAMITVVASVPANVAAGLYTNTAHVGSPAPENNLLNNTATAAVTVNTPVALAVSKRASPNPATPGEALRYTILITNSGPALARGITVSDTLPAGFSADVVVSTAGICTVVGQLLTCTLGDLEVGSHVTIFVDGSLAAHAFVSTALLINRVAVADQGSATATAQVTTALAPQADLAVRKFAPANGAPSDTLVYTITVENLGPSTAPHLYLTDTLPADLTFIAMTKERGGSTLDPLGATCNQTGDLITCTESNLLVGERLTYLITATVNSNVAPGIDLQNRVDVATDALDPNLSNNRADADTAINVAADLVVTKQQLAPMGAVTAGDLVTYSLLVTNNGPGIAKNVVLRDTLPTDLRLLAMSAQTGLCGGASCLFGDLAVGATHTATVVARVDNAATGPVINVATVTSDNEYDYTNNIDDATTSVAQLAALTISKQATPLVAVPGELLDYAVRVVNDGPSAAATVLISDVLPAGFTALAVSSDPAGCSTLPCTFAMLATGATAHVYIQGRVAGAVTNALINVATVTSTTPLTQIANTSTTLVTALSPRADLTLRKIAPANVRTGDTLAYTLTVNNNGPSDAQNVVVTDTLPTGVNFAAATAGCVNASGVVTCALGTLAAGASQLVTLTVAVDDDLAGGTALLNRASVGSSTPDADRANNDDDALTMLAVVADLLLDKQGPSTIIAGAAITYTIVVTNRGPGTLPWLDVKDSLPAGITLQRATVTRNDGGLAACGGAICQTGDLATGGVLTITLRALVDPTLATGAVLTNTATLFTTVDDPTPTDHQATVTTTVRALADLVVTKVALADRVAALGTLPYEVTVFNRGPAAAQSVILSDTLDNNVTFAGASANCAHAGAPTGGLITCTVGTLLPNASVSFLFAVRAGDVPSGTLLANAVSVTSTTALTNTSDDRAAVTTGVTQNFGPTADLGLTKTGDPAGVVAGERVTYTLVVTNVGPQTATNVRLLDLIPAGTTATAVSVNHPANALAQCARSGFCELGSIGLAATVTITLVLAVAPDFASDTITNTATVLADQPDPDGSDNIASATTAVTQLADLSIRKSGLISPTIVGEVLPYQLLITNHGPSTAQAVVVTDSLPAQVSFAGATPGCLHDGAPFGGDVVCLLGDLAVGATQALLIDVRIDPSLTVSTTLFNSATVAGTTGDLDLSNNNATATTLAQPGALLPVDLAIVKTVTPAVVNAGEPLTYTLVITNNGPGVASNVRLLDALPAGLNATHVTSSQGLCNHSVVCEVGDLAAGATITLTLLAAVDSTAAAGTITNRTRVAASNADSDPANNESSIAATVTIDDGLQITKVAPAIVSPGQSIVYQIIVSNTGPSAATNVVVSDTVPAAISNFIAITGQGGCVVNSTMVTCNLGVILPGASVVIAINGYVRSDASGALINRARAVSAADPVGVIATTTTSVGQNADLLVALQTTPTTNAGGQITATATVYNNGPSLAENIVVTLTLPAGTTLASTGLPSGWFATDNGDGTVTITATQTLTPGVGIDLPIVVDVDSSLAPGSSLEFTIVASTTTPDPNLFNNSDDADSSIIGDADLIIAKHQLTADPIQAGELVTYTITITNSGPGSARAVDLKDQLPTGLTLAAISASDDGLCGGTVCQFGTLPVNATRTVTVVARVASNWAAGSFINTAAVFSPDDDDLPAANTDSVTTVIATQANLRVRKIDLFDPVAPGRGQLYQLLVYNEGPSDAQSVVITDVLDSNVGFAGASPECQTTGGIVTCTLATLPAQSSAAFFVAVNVSEALLSTDQLTNRVVVTAATVDPVGLDNRATATTTVANFGTLADLGVRKTTQQATVTAGETLGYTLVVTNAGPSAASNVQLLELIPPGTTLVAISANNPDSASEFCTSGGSCQLGTIYIDTVVTVTALLRVNSDFTGADLTNRASVVADQADPHTSNNFTEVTTAVTPNADLAIVKRGLVSPTVVGEILPYQLLITNHGPSAAADVVVTDTLPGRVSFAGATAGCRHDGAAFGGEVICDIGALATGAIQTLLIDVRVDPSLAVSTTLFNGAKVTSLTADKDLTNNAATATTLAEPSARLPVDLAIAKRLTPTTVVAGENITYTLVVTNHGPGVASNVRVIDSLPNGLQATAINASQGLCNDSIVCELGDLANGATATVTVVAVVDSGVAAGNVINRARVVASNPDTNQTNNESSVIATVVVADALQIQKLGPTSVTGGQSIVYQISVGNGGPSDAINVVLSDTLPATIESVIAVSNQGDCAVTGQVVNCTIARLTPGARVVIAIYGRVNSNVDGDLVNRARVTSAADTTGVIDVVTTTVALRADLVLALMTTPTANAGETITALVTLFNNGPSVAAGNLVTLTLPPSTTLAGITLPAGWFATDHGDGTVTITTTNTLATGTGITVGLTVAVAAGVEPGSSLEFQAVATTTTPDLDPTNNRATSDTTILGLADLMLTKRGLRTVTAGTGVTYTIVVTNLGPSVAHFVDIKDQLPDNITLVRSRLTRSGSGNALCSGTICQPGDMAMGEVVTMTVVGLVASDLLTGTRLTNLATVFAVSPDPDEANNSESTAATVETVADLAIRKQALPVTAVPGNELTYVLTISNRGPSAAQVVVVADTLPVGFIVITTTSSHGGCVSLPCTLGTLPADGSATITIIGQVDRAVTTALVNRAQINSSTPDPSHANNTTTITTNVTPQANLTIALDSTPTVNGGETATVTVTLVNQGPSDALGTVVTVTLPPSAALAGNSLPAGWSVVDNGGGTLTLTTTNALLAGQNVSLLLNVAIDDGVEPGSSLAFSATATATTPDPDLTDNGANSDTSVVSRADLALTQYGPTTAVAGTAVTYTVIVTNYGPSVAHFVDVNDGLPSGLSLLAATVIRSVAGLTGCVGALCQLGDLALGEVVKLTYVALVSPDLVAATTLTNTAIVLAVTVDPNESNNRDHQVSQVQTLADLRITKRALSSPARPGQTLAYLIEVHNAGPSAARNGVVTDLLPAGFTVSTVTSSQGGCAALPCTLGTIAANGDATVTIVGQVASNVTTALVNLAQVGSSTPDPSSANNTTNISTLVAPQANLTLDLDSTPTGNSGATATVTVTLVNQGPADALGTVVMLTLPPGTTLASNRLPSGWSVIDNDDGTLKLATTTALPNGQTVNLPLIVTISEAIEPGSSLAFSAIVTATTPDPDPTNNQANSDTSVVGSADLALTKRGPSMVVVGSLVTYTIVVTNHGPSVAHFVDIKDQLPVGVNLVNATVMRSATPGAVSLCSGAICQLGDVGVGEQVTMMVIGRVDAYIAAGTTVVNTAAVFAVSPDPDPTNNLDRQSSSVQTLARLRVDKRDLIDPVAPGALLLYVIEAVNDGPSVARNVIVNDSLPSGLIYMGSTGPCRLDGTSTLICPMGDLDPGTTRSFQLTLLVQPTLVNSTRLTNNILATSNTPLTGDSVLTASAETLVQEFLGPPADLALSKQAAQANVMTGDLLTYTLVVTNNGPASANDVRVVDLLPTGLTLVNVQSSQGLCNQSINCLMGTLPFNGTPSYATITVVARVATNVDEGVQLINSALVQSSQPDPNENNNLGTATVVNRTTANLAVQKSAAPNPLIAGADVHYTIVLTNYGPADAINVVLNDSLPAQLTEITINSSQGACDSSGLCRLARLAAGSRVEIAISGRLAATANGYITNTVAVTSDTLDPQLNNNQATVTTPVVAQHDLAALIASRPTVHAGNPATVTVTVYNYGPSVALGTVVTITLPAGVTLTSTNFPSGWVLVSNQNGVLTVVNQGALLPGTTVQLPLVVTFASDLPIGSSHQFGVAVSDDSGAVDPLNNQDDADTSVVGFVDLAITKRSISTIVEAGATVIYQIEATNLGPSLATNVEIRELLPPQLHLLQLTAARGICIGQICQIGLLAVGERVVVTAVTQVDPATPLGTFINNITTVSSGSSDLILSNNEHEFGIRVGPLADLAITKRTVITMAVPGDLVPYVVEVVNRGPSLAANVVVTDVLPAGFHYVRSDGLCREIGRDTLRCSLGTMAVNAVASFTILTVLGQDVSTGVQRNQAWVGSDASYETDPLNNVADALIAVLNTPTALEQVSLWALPSQGAVTLEWLLPDPNGTAGFIIWRSDDGLRAHAVRLTPTPLKVIGMGGEYRFIDRELQPGIVYAYWLEELHTDGSSSQHGPVTGIAPARLYQIYMPLLQRTAVGAARNTAPAMPENGTREAVRNQLYLPLIYLPLIWR